MSFKKEITILSIIRPEQDIGYYRYFLLDLFRTSENKLSIEYRYPVLWSRSRPEPDFLAGAGEKGSGSGLLLFGFGVLWYTKKKLNY